MNPNEEEKVDEEPATYGGGTPWLVYWGRKIRHWLAHLVPRTHWTNYRIEAWEQSDLDEDQQWICIWRQWLGFQWDEVHFRVVEAT